MFVLAIITRYTLSILTGGEKTKISSIMNMCDCRIKKRQKFVMAIEIYHKYCNMLHACKIGSGRNEHGFGSNKHGA